MTVDWVTVSAQIVNFLILVWLLKRFLYRPVIDAMARREQRIADRLGEAASREREANAEGDKYRGEREALEHRRDEILAEAMEEAEGVKKQMLEEGREEAAAARDNWLRMAAHEETEFLTNLRRETAGVVQAAARKALADLAGVELEAAMAERFVQRLETLPDGDRKALARSDGPVTITSAFELTPGVRGKLTRTVHALLGRDADVDYRCSPELICGVELTSGGRRLSWNLADYMDRLAERVEASFQPVTAADPPAGPPSRGGLNGEGNR